MNDLARAFFFAVVTATAAAETSPFADLVPGTHGTVKFAESPPQSADPDEVRARLSAAEIPPPYDVTKETFDILLPPKHDHATPHGLFVWVPAADQPGIPAEWEPVLARHRLIFIGAHRSGNRRNIFDRIRLAVDANHNARRFTAIDGRRVYVSGFSGGGRVASMLGVAWGDMFSGAIPCMGVNFYTDVTAPDGKTYTLNYRPDDALLDLVKRFCRFALITGEQDFNRANTLGVFENGFTAEGFRHARVFEVPGHGHQPPPAVWLDRAIAFLDEGKDLSPPP